MAASVRENYCLSTDLADALAARGGLPYRQVYHLVGDWVKQAMAQGQAFDQLTAAELVAFAATQGLDVALTEAAYAAIVDPLAAVSRRTTIGAPAPARVAEMLGSYRADLAARAAWRTELAGRAAAAERGIYERFEGLAAHV
jgi:argininosuccinate lyase